MPEYLYTYEDVDGTANEEETADILEGTKKKPKHVVAVMYIEDTAALQHDAILRAYKDRTRIVDMPIQAGLLNNGSDDRLENLQWIEIDTVFEAGEELQVGTMSGGNATDVLVVAKYYHV